AAVPVLEGDDAAALADRVLAAEHRLYPACLARLAAGSAGVQPAADAVLANPA
ncbi:MAG: phosphoribosylglycinamide formyltransferase, partial [Kiloniellales bacterium]